MQRRPMKCISCGWPRLTLDEARRSYGRMVGHGVAPDVAKKLSPRCYRCTSTVLREGTPAPSGPSVQSVK